MGLLSWLLGSSDTREDANQDARASVDWQALENALAQSIHLQVGAFSAAHPDERFYGFAIDCNADYANVLFCLNTDESLEATARDYANEDTPAEVARQKAEMAWALGDWKYQGFNLDSRSWADEVPMLDDFAELPNSQDTEAFLQTCCRALIRAEKDGAFDGLRRTTEFRVACIDHDEDVVDGDRRLDQVRASS